MCNSAEEDAAHVFQCARVSEVWPKAVDPIQTWMRRVNTDQVVSDVIIDGLTSFQRAETPRVSRTDLPCDVQGAAVEQDAIGWQNFVDGFVPVKWVALMEARFVARSRRCTGRGWMMGLLRHLWRLS